MTKFTIMSKETGTEKRKEPNISHLCQLIRQSKHLLCSLFNLGKVNSILPPKRFCEFWMIFDKTGFQVENDIDEKESTEAKYF